MLKEDAPQTNGKNLFFLLRKLLREEKERERKRAHGDRVKAEVVSITEDAITFSCERPGFEEGDAVGYFNGEEVVPIGLALTGGSFLTVERSKQIELKEDQEVELCRNEVLIGYDLQISLMDRILEGGLDEIGRNAVLCVLGGLKFGDLKRREISDRKDARGRIELDESQVEAVECILGLDDFELLIIVGPPGTGKTKVIAKAALELQKRGERVLIASHTNRAVDNALESLPVDISLRVGRPEKVLEEIRPYLLSYKARTALGSRLERIEKEISNVRNGLKELNNQLDDWKRIRYWEKYRETKEIIKREHKKLKDLYEERNKMLTEESRKLVGEARIIGSTLIKSGLPPLNDENFDIVLIDECSQASISLALLGMMKARKWVLVGDHKQLLPIFQSIKDKNELEMLSSFCRMRNLYRNREIWLTRHYRSNSRIINFSCKYVYDGKISPVKECERIKLEIRGYPVDMEFLNPDIPVVFLHVNGDEGVEGGSRYNSAEVLAVDKLVRTLKRLGIDGTRIGVITPYRAQRNRIAESLKDDRVEVNTVDSFQGREKDVIIFSVTSTEDMGFVGDENRLNVAFTRARKKLIVVGNAESIERSQSAAGLLYKYVLYARDLGGFFKWRI